MKLHNTIAAAGALLLAASGIAQSADKMYGPGVSDSEIKLGTSVPYSGPASFFGSYGKVMTAYFEMLNDKGGINGRKINLISLDNAYTPPKALEQTRKLVEEEEVLAEVGTVGTAPNVATMKYLNKKKVPQLMISAGGSRFHDPKGFPWTISSYPGFEMEAGNFANHILASKPAAKIGVLYQNDDYGKDYLKGLKNGLGAKAGNVIAEESYEITDATVDAQVLALRAAGIDTLMLFVTPKFAAQAIKKLGETGWKPTLYICSPSNSVKGTLAKAGAEHAVGAYTTQFIKQPGDPAYADDADVKVYLDFMKRYAPNLNPEGFVGLSGYVASQVIAHVLDQAGDNLTRENVMKAATSIKGFRPEMVLPGIELNSGSDDYTLYKSLRMARFDGTSWILE